MFSSKNLRFCSKYPNECQLKGVFSLLKIGNIFLLGYFLRNYFPL